MPIHLGRWEIDIYQRTLHVTRGPHPHCPTCAGHGGIENGGEYVLDHQWQPEVELCDCWDPAPVVRIPLWARRAEEVPF